MGEVNVKLSFDQASMLMRAVGEVMDHNDVAENRFPDQTDLDNAHDAYEALRVAWAKAAQRRAGVR